MYVWPGLTSTWWKSKIDLAHGIPLTQMANPAVDAQVNSISSINLGTGYTHTEAIETIITKYANDDSLSFLASYQKIKPTTTEAKRKQKCWMCMHNYVNNNHVQFALGELIKYRF